MNNAVITPGSAGADTIRRVGEAERHDPRGLVVGQCHHNIRIACDRVVEIPDAHILGIDIFRQGQASATIGHSACVTGAFATNCHDELGIGRVDDAEVRKGVDVIGGIVLELRLRIPDLNRAARRKRRRFGSDLTRRNSRC